MKIKLTLLLFIIITSQLLAQLPHTVFKELWGTHFQLRKTEQGEILSISSVSVHNNTIYLYDMAERKIVSLDSNFTFIQEVPLATIGRNTYVGDDFVILQNKAIFLNTVDRRLEIFDLATGSHKGSVTYPYGYFSKEPRRRQRIINKIFLDNNQVILGNSHKVFSFDIESGTPIKDKTAVSVEKGHKLLLYSSKQVVSKIKQTVQWKGAPYQAIHNSFLISGKQYFILKNRLYAFTLDNSRICIVRVEKRSEQ